MKKFGLFILSIFCMFSVVTFVACDNSVEDIYFTEQCLEMYIGDEVEISTLLHSKIDINNLKIQSYDSNVVSVVEHKLIATNSGATFVTASYENANASMEVIVIGQPVVADTPNGLTYDVDSEFVTWNYVVVQNDDIAIPVSSYSLNITKNNQQLDDVVVYENKYKLSDAGEYEIKVKANALISNGVTLYGGSEYSQTIKVNILSKPFDVSYDDTTKTLSWNAQSDINSFVVIVNGVQSEVTQNKNMKVEFDSINKIQNQDFVVSVVSAGSTNVKQDQILKTAQSEQITYTRLFAPQMTIQDGVIVWNEQPDLIYELTRTSPSGTTTTEVVTGGQYSFEGLATGTYTNLSLKVKSDNELYLESTNQSVLNNANKLAATTISFDVQTLTFKATNFEGKNIELYIKSDSFEQQVTMQNGQYIWDNDVQGEYEVYAIVKAQNENEINSDKSNTIKIKQLAKVNSINQFVENGDYCLQFGEVEGADLYVVSYIKDEEKVILAKSGEYIYGKIDILFDLAKTYTITIEAQSQSLKDGETFIIPSSVQIFVVRLEDLQPSLDDVNSPANVLWNANQFASNYDYVFNKNSQVFNKGLTQTNNYPLTDLEYGTYSFMVKAIGGNIDGILYLDSLNYKKVDFQVETKLQSPLLQFDRDSKQLTVLKVALATSYEIKLNELDLSYTDEFEDKIVIDLTQNLQNDGTYNVYVIAKNAQETLILDSEVSSIAIIKLQAPKNINLSSEGEITLLNYPDENFLDDIKESIFINDQQTNILNDDETFNVKAKFNATTLNIENSYYLDSEYTTFTIHRLQKPNSPTLEETVISWESVDKPNFKYRLNITQDNSTNSVLYNDTNVDVFDSMFRNVNLNRQFVFSVSYEFTGAEFELGDEIIYFSSHETLFIVNKIGSDINMKVAENDGRVIVSWEESDVEGVEYKLSLNSNNIYSGENNSLDITENVIQPGVYTLRLKISKPDYISSEYIEIYVERLTAISSITINDDEDVIVNTNYKTSEQVKNDEIAQLDHVEIKVGENQIANLQELTGNINVNVELIAKVYETGKYYYLNSGVATFSFTRYNTPSAPTIFENEISFDEVESVDNYLLQFTCSEKIRELQTNSSPVSTLQKEVQDIITYFANPNFDVAVKYVKKSFVANVGANYYLSSKFSEKSSIIKLQPVTNVTIVAEGEDDYQQVVKISWNFDSQDVKIKDYTVEIYKNEQLYKTETVDKELNYILVDDMLESARYYAVVKVNGTENYINSDATTSDIVTRLAIPTNLNINSQTAVLNFTGVENALGYVASYEFSESIKNTQTLETTTWDLSTLIYENKFSGDIKVTIFALGGKGLDENKTLSSQVCEEFIITKTQSGEIILYTDHLVAGVGEDDGATYYITISTDDQVVKNLELPFGAEYYYEDFVYPDRTMVEVDVEKQFTFTVQKLINSKNYVKSDETQYNVTKLPIVKNFGFIRHEDDVNSTIWLKGDSVEHATKYVVSILDKFSTDLSTQYSSYFELAFNEDVYQYLDNMFSVSVYAQGEISGIANYINSSITQITNVIVLPKLSQFMVQNGELTWNKIDNASDYALKISESETKTGYVVDGIHTTKDSLKSKSGLLSLNIKAVGNIKDELKTSDIILDSLYLEQNYECQKLVVPTNFAVTNGYISLTPVENATNYVAMVDGNSYDLDEVSIETGYSLMFSQSMYNNLKPNFEYQVTVRATSTLPDIIYSDDSQFIKIKILANTTRGTLEIVFRENTTNNFDPTVSKLIWQDDPDAKNGYTIDLDSITTKTNINNYILDEDDQLIPNHDYSIKVRIDGGSKPESDGCYHLNSDYGEVLTFKKLDMPYVELSQGYLAWGISTGATGYNIYLDGELYNQNPISDAFYLSVDLGDIKSNKEYNSYAVRAVSNNPYLLASSYSYYKDEEGNNIKITKLHSPDKLGIKDGAFIWDITSIFSLMPLMSGQAIQNPYTATLDSLKNASDLLDIKFKSIVNEEENGAEFIFQDYAARFINLSQSILDLIKNYGGVSDEDIEQLKYQGWPNNTRTWLNLGNELPAGEYSVSTRQVGDSLDRLTSNFGTTMQVYVPHAPKIKMIYSKDQYFLQWDAIQIPEKYAMSEVKYKVIAFKEDGTRDELLDTTDTSCNITDMITNGTLTREHTALWVFVIGNNSNVLNGKGSNLLQTNILTNVQAFVHNGELSWTAQEGVVEYLITYQETNNSNSAQTYVTEKTYWDCAQLSSKIDTYDVYIQAIGEKMYPYSYGPVILTGPNTNIGKVKKLETPKVNINDGVFEWDKVENSTSYKIKVNDGETDKFVTVENVAQENGLIQYETTFKAYDLGYTFQSIGDLDLELNSRTLAYVNSESGNLIYGTAIASVEDIYVKDGVLSWKTVTNNSVVVNHYKLTFNKIDGNTIADDSIIVADFNFNGQGDRCYYDGQKILSYGKYQVVIQAFYKTDDRQIKYYYGDQEAYYLMSVKSEPYTFEKYNYVQGVDDLGVVQGTITLKDGMFTWVYAEILDHEVDYELKFTSTSGTEYTAITSQQYYCSNIVDEIMVNENYTLQIRVIAKQGSYGYMNGEYLEFKNIHNDNKNNIYQLNGIDQNDIILKTMDDSNDLYINWDNYELSSGTNNLEQVIDANYLVTYWTNVNPEKRTKLISTKYINTSEFEFNINDSFILYYTIQVLPIGNMSYVPSCQSERREIQKPSSVSEVFFDTNGQYFYWSTDGTSTDHTFRIRDEIYKVDAFGSIITDGENNPILLRTYTFTTLDNLTGQYYPLEQGIHKVSVAVVVKNSGDQGSLTSSYTYYYDYLEEPENKDVGTCVLINLFDIIATDEVAVGGMGTVEKPYTISNENQFNNINYRLQKPSYENSYILTKGEENTRVNASEQDQQYNFKLTSDLSGVKTIGTDSKEEFKGNFDGSYHKITWDCNLSTINANNKRQSLFSKIGTGAQVHNLKILVNVNGTLSTGGTIALLTNENAGKIDNIVLGEENLNITISSNYDIYWYGITATNSGTITNVVNYYDVSLSNSTSRLGIKVGYAAVAGTNNGLVSQCANYGDITIQSTQADCGGIVATNNATVEKCVLKNDKTSLNIAKISSGAISFVFGGVVGRNANNGKVSYSYAYTNTIINRSAPSTSSNNSSIYIAGLVGLSSNGLIDHSYVYNIITATATSGLDLGNIYIFAYIRASTTGSGTKCYYNNDSTRDAIGGLGSNNFDIKSYQNHPSGTAMNETDASYYTVNENTFPVLNWENDFNSVWKNK